MKPVKKMIKKELIEYINECEEREMARNEAMKKTMQYQEDAESRERKLREEKAEALTALELWKSGCLEAQKVNNTIQEKLLVLRQTLAAELIKTPIKDDTLPEDQKSIIHLIVKAIAKKFIEIEDKVSPIVNCFPIPKVLNLVQEARREREKEELANAFRNKHPQGFFN